MNSHEKNDDKLVLEFIIYYLTTMDNTTMDNNNPNDAPVAAPETNEKTRAIFFTRQSFGTAEVLLSRAGLSLVDMLKYVLEVERAWTLFESNYEGDAGLKEQYDEIVASVKEKFAEATAKLAK